MQHNVLNEKSNLMLGPTFEPIYVDGNLSSDFKSTRLKYQVFKKTYI